MITYFPPPFPDECLYSVISRYILSTLLQSPKEISQLLFSNRNVKSSLDLPAFISALYSNIKNVSSLTEHEIINTLTLYPFYKKFLKLDKRNQIFDLMLLSKASDIHTKIGINASKIHRSRYPLYCPKCVVEDERKFGIPYFHNSHQIPDIKICPIHGCYLNTIRPTINELNAGNYVSPMRMKDDVAVHSCDNKLLQSIAKDFCKILDQSSSFDLAKIDHHRKVVEFGFTRQNSLDRIQISDHFQKFFGHKNLEAACGKSNNNYAWVSDLVLNPARVFHPLKQILVYNFIESLHLVKSKKADHPFGSGPWPCINKTSDHFMRNVVFQLKTHIDKKSKRLVGEFSCVCGMVYTKSFIKRSNGSKVEFVRIKDLGHIWQERFNVEISSGKGLRELSRVLGVDPSKIKKMSKRNVVVNDQPDLFNQGYREQWLDILRQSPYETIVSCRMKAPNVYTWLYRHDRQWLIKINLQHKRPEKKTSSKLNWSSLDQEILSKLQVQVASLKCENNLNQITRTLLAKLTKTEQYLLGKNIAKLPKSDSYIKSQTESTQQYQYRRFKAAVDFYTERHEPLKVWKINRMAGLKNSTSPEMIHLIESLAKKL